MSARAEAAEEAGKFRRLGRAFIPYFTAGWSAEGISRASQVTAAMLGLAAPLAVGVMSGHAGIAVAASLGGLALGGEGEGESLRAQAPRLIYTLAAGSAAMLVGSAAAGHAALIIGIAAAASLSGSISRPLARATTQFMLYAIIAASLGSGEAHPFGVMVLFFLGAAWTAGLSLALRPLFGFMHLQRISDRPEAVPPPKYTARQLLRRWWKSLAHLRGWQYTLRITLCLVAAQGFEWLWPGHHGYWALITVMIVVQRDLRAALQRTFQRGVGTMVGVLLTGVLLLGSSSSAWATVLVIAVLAAARPVFRGVNYTAYTAVHTPLIILLLDFGQGASWAVMVDRLAATLFGCAVALALGYLMWSRGSPPAVAAVESKRNPAGNAGNRANKPGRFDHPG
jgi:hypothetical protein